MGGLGSIVTGIISAIMQARAAQLQYQAQQEALKLGRENLDFQKSSARQQQRLATAARTDAYGNKQSYNDLLNEWITQLTPTQTGIVRAGEREQRLNLTEDAMRNRDVRRAQADRAREARTDYNQAQAEARYGGPPSEGAILDQLTQLLANQRAGRQAQTLAPLSTAALRLGQGGQFPALIRAAQAQSRETAADDALKARQAALAEYQTRLQAHRSDTSGRMEQAARTMDSVGQTAPMMSTTPQAMSGQQSEMLSAITNAIANGAGRIGGAYQGLADQQGRTFLDLSRINLSGIGSGLDELFKSWMSQGGRDDMTMKPIVYNPRRGEEIYWPVPPGGTGGTGNNRLF